MVEQPKRHGYSPGDVDRVLLALIAGTAAALAVAGGLAPLRSVVGVAVITATVAAVVATAGASAGPAVGAFVAIVATGAIFGYDVHSNVGSAELGEISRVAVALVVIGLVARPLWEVVVRRYEAHVAAQSPAATTAGGLPRVEGQRLVVTLRPRGDTAPVDRKPFTR